MTEQEQDQGKTANGQPQEPKPEQSESEPLSAEEREQYALWAWRNPNTDKTSGTSRLLAALRDAETRLDAANYTLRYGTPFDPTGAKTGSEILSLRASLAAAERRAGWLLRNRASIGYHASTGWLSWTTATQPATVLGKADTWQACVDAAIVAQAAATDSPSGASVLVVDPSRSTPEQTAALAGRRQGKEATP